VRKLQYHKSRNDDGTNNGSIFFEKFPGHAYCVAKAPKFVSDEQWERDAKLFVNAERMLRIIDHIATDGAFVTEELIEEAKEILESVGDFDPWE